MSNSAPIAPTGTASPRVLVRRLLAMRWNLMA
jgi:hypothetical protein